MENATPLVSVIVPVYNGERYLAAALDAALAQTYRNLEVIVVDDGSRDRTRGVADAYAVKDPRVRVIAQANRGVAGARNRGIAESKGELIAPLDADDLWDPAKIERQVERMLAAGAGTGVVYSWWLWIDGGGAVIDRSPRWSVEGQAADALLQVNFIGCASIPLFRRTHLEQVGGYDERLDEGCEDWDLSLRMAERGALAVVPEMLVAYRRQSTSMSAATAKMWRACHRVHDLVRARRPGLDRALLRYSEDQFALYLAGVSYWSGAYREAVGWGVRALRSRLAFEVLPSVVGMIGRPRRASGITLRAGEPFAALALPAPLIPYDRIYARRFARAPRHRSRA